MIKKFSIENFSSIYERQEIDFSISQKEKLDDSARTSSDGQNINLAISLVGHNASGKTSILKALTFGLFLALRSYSTIKLKHIPYTPHALCSGKNSKFEIEFYHESTLYLYKIEFNRERIIKEYFGSRVKKGFTRIFEYERNIGDGWNFKSPGIAINKNDLKRMEERTHSSVLSSLISLDYIPAYSSIDNFYSNVDRFGLVSNSRLINKILEISNELHDDDSLTSKTISFLKEIDIGIDSFSFRELVNESKGKEGTDVDYLLQSLHKSNGAEYYLDFLEESNGTQLATIMYASIIPVLEHGGVAILDEIDSGLHPYVTKKIISLFEREHTNPNNAQILYSTHQHILLNDRTKTQIFIAEKHNPKNQTEIYRLDEVEGVRNDENYFHKYISGAYGGTPSISYF